MDRPVPFPLVSGRYEVGPTMRRFGQAGQGFPTEEGHFQPDSKLAATLEAKLAVLRQAPAESHLVVGDITPVEERDLRMAIRETFGLLATEHPAIATLESDAVMLHHLGLRVANLSAPTPELEPVGDGWPQLHPLVQQIHSWLATRQGLERLGDALGLSVQEDLAIVRGPAVGAVKGPAPDVSGDGAEVQPDVLEWMHVCLPSNWAPADKIGRCFGAVHDPVVHNEQLIASHDQIIRAMIHAGPFVRYVWGLHRDAELGHNPRLHQARPWRKDATPAELAAQAYFRVERQTTHGFPHLNRALFTIRYWVQPLAEAAEDPWRRERIRTALAGMDEAALRYKGLTGARDRLVEWLGAEF